MDIYAASCNPPRRAKRLRADSDTPGLTRESVSSPCPSNPDEDDDDAVPHPPPPKRRGRKPGSMSRAAREAQRKINHSLIEKARRTKINDALATLRQLVPADYKRAASASDDHQEDSDDDNHDPTTASKPNRQKPRVSSSGEKEFKLEVLIRTVAYLQVLTEKVKALERDGCPHCERPISGLTDDSPLRRIHSVTVADAYTRPSEPQKLTSPPSRLPSISTWLPTLTPSQSPSRDLPADVGGNSLPPTTHLPTPPTSATFPPSSAIAAGAPPPALTLPSPGTFLPSAVRGFPSGFARATSSTNVSGANKPVTVSGNNKGSPGASSPIYTPEDETAASLLLRMSTSNSPTSPQHAFGRLRSSSSASSLTSLWPSLPALEPVTTVSTTDVLSQDFESVRRSDARLTPSRLLGLTRRSPDGR
ncbi:hypothetical protein BKA82DRAFT_995800 [Pisolithus tinctorius]|uniref:BHLH domain-containing protein n=1 Tax=Pisolithus tinctorius Marx 270 TaxID=870435 RepID=A0A0C3PN43_PISTI|nr:hypothetical protein BKA82DRAFT_995800 [Pisolithus tinctorius]KIO09799.1 hypothetical protein M404DRAFT_995800 [Pisolithus tinctorius Marx 270]